MWDMILDLIMSMGKQTSGGSFLSSFLGAKPTTGASGLGAEASYDTPMPTTFGERMSQGLKGMSTTGTQSQSQSPQTSTNIGRFNQPTTQPNTQNMLTQMLIQMLQRR